MIQLRNGRWHNVETNATSANKNKKSQKDSLNDIKNEVSSAEKREQLLNKGMYTTFVRDTEVSVIGDLDTGEMYEFDQVLIIRDPNNGKVYAGHDSGGSIHEPFEDFEDFSDWTPINSKNEAIDFAKRNLYHMDANDTQDLMSELNQYW